MYDQHTGRKASESMHSGQRELKFVQVKKLQIAWLNLYGMPFHEQHSIGYGFPSLLLVTCASAGVSELFLSTRGFATRA